MATVSIGITFTTPQGMTATEFSRLLSDNMGYQTTVDGQPNPETRAAFCRRMVGEHVMARVKLQRLQEAYASVALEGDVTAS